MNRQEGYYWVKYNNIFEIAEYLKFKSKNKFWQRVGENDYYNDSDFEHINENRIKFPGELPD